jgi:hypothetical protein
MNLVEKFNTNFLKENILTYRISKEQLDERVS